MKILLLSGLGPIHKNFHYFDGTLFDPKSISRLENSYFRVGDKPFNLNHLYFSDDNSPQRLLRPRRGTMPHLTTTTLEWILRRNDYEYDLYRLEDLFDGVDYTPPSSIKYVLLSTTFLCNFESLNHVLAWVKSTIPDSVVVLGGQFSNLKYRVILDTDPRVDYVLTGDGEESIPALLRALDGRGSFESVPNLARRDRESGQVLYGGLQYINLEEYPSPTYEGKWPVVPYESMRGCPFQCRFCSYPSASPQWRYKSAQKIFKDWQGYVVQNGATHIKSMDSTFTVPPKRLAELLTLLPRLEGATWESYSRANIINSEALVKQLEDSHCRELSIGFESMSENSLSYMKKQTHAIHNRRAAELLSNSSIWLRASFLIGYPGETPEDFQETLDYLKTDFRGWYMASVFGFTDETMPVWDDIEKFNIRFTDESSKQYTWSHSGMDIHEARTLFSRTLDEVRRNNDDACLLMWQVKYDRPLVPSKDKQDNLKIEKLVDRIGMLPRDYPNEELGREKLETLLSQLAELGVLWSDTQVELSR